MDNNTYEYTAAKYPIINNIKFDDNCYLVTYHPTVDADLCKYLGIDIVKLMNKFKIKDSSKTCLKDVSVSISAAWTAYGRIHISKLKLDIINKGGNIYYSDTDSIVTDIALDDKLVLK